MRKLKIIGNVLIVGALGALLLEKVSGSGVSGFFTKLSCGDTYWIVADAQKTARDVFASNSCALNAEWNFIVFCGVCLFIGLKLLAFGQSLQRQSDSRKLSSD